MTIDDMRKLFEKHHEFETKEDIEGVLSTLVDNPVYEFFPARVRLEGRDNVRQFYRDHFAEFFPLIDSYILVNECWDTHSACLEYDLFLKSPNDPKRACRVMVVLTAQNGLLIGERFYVDNELARLMAGGSFNKFVKQQ